MFNTRWWQWKMMAWHNHAFGNLGPQAARVYSMRVLEEALELAQAEGVRPVEVAHIVQQVYAKPAGEPAKELGGLLITITGYANMAGLSIEDVFRTEYNRIQDPVLIEKIRYRNFHGDKIGLRKKDLN